MPIISNIGRRSWKVRCLYALIYLALGIGAVTVMYPLMLMLAGSVKSEADAWAITPYPEFWTDDLVLFRKYAEAKYNGQTVLAQSAWCRPVTSWRMVERPAAVEDHWAAAFEEWRAARPRPHDPLGFLTARGLAPKNLRAYRRKMAQEYNNDIEAYNEAANQLFVSWNFVQPPTFDIGRSVNPNIPKEFLSRYESWVAERPPEESIVTGMSGPFALEYLRGRYTQTIATYNEAHGTTYAEYGHISLPERVPPDPGPAREDWEDYIRTRCNFSNIRLDRALQPDFKRYLADTFTSVKQFNRQRGTTFATLDDVPFPENLADAPYLRPDFDAFIKDATRCPAEALILVDPEREFMEFCEVRFDGDMGGYPGLGPIVAAVDWKNCMERKRELRREFTVRNYAMVIDYLLLHGNAIRNTAIYCLLAVLTALIVNPLAAYALSRFNLPGTYKILLFCMATMAFPGEVAMIPGFMLRKRFPLWPLVASIGACLATFRLLELLAPRWRENLRALIALAVGLLVGAVGVPAWAPDATYVNLLNTYAALVLPGMANGYSIFLLKGFFDSQPRELYEAADLDGAGEWTKFWSLTINLSKPILAVIALGAFTAAYSNFMMAILTVPDRRMWTLMVWIFQLQSESHQSVVYASLVIAAIPTFMVFVLCQNIIIRGIVVPTEK